VGTGDDHAEHMRALISARVDEICDAIRGRALREVEIQAARSEEELTPSDFLSAMVACTRMAVPPGVTADERVRLDLP
jgi:hypothetical protein